MANTDGSYRLYNNGPSGWTEYNAKGEAITYGADAGNTTPTPQAQYVTNKDGQRTSQFTQGNAIYNVLPGSIFDPLSPNYDPTGRAGGSVGGSSGYNGASGGNGGLGGSSGGVSGGGYGGLASSPYTTSTVGTPQSISQSSYEQKLADLARQTATAAADAKKFALKQAWEGNSQALNAQNATVDNNFNSAKNNLTALQTTRAGEYQGQKDTTSQEAAAQLRRIQALNALTGNYNSGYNRSQMNDVGLARQGSLDAIQGSQNTFNTGVANQISDADAQRVAALNDIAGKLQLGQKQLNDGTLNLDTQLASDVATGSLKASLDAQTWGDTQRQLGIDNSARQAQLDLNIRIADAQQAYQNGQLSLEQANAAINQALAISGTTGTYNGAPTMAAQNQSADNAYRNAALAQDQSQFNSSLESSNANAAASRAASSDRSNTPTAAQQKANISADAYDEINYQLSRGNSPTAIIQSISSQRGDLIRQGIDPDELIKYVQANSGKVTTKEDENGDIISTLGSYIPLDGSLESLRRLGGGSI